MTEPTTTYTVDVYVGLCWPTGALKQTTTRRFQITESATVLGGLRAIDAAVAQCESPLSFAMCDVHSPDISPNPAELGWPIGEYAADKR